jgi:hypothetical protein
MPLSEAPRPHTCSSETIGLKVLHGANAEAWPNPIDRGFSKVFY